MKVSGSYTFDAPRQVVWEALNDLDVLARIVPGCQRLEQTGENEFAGTLKIGIAAVKGIYSGKIRLEDVEVPRHYKLVASGRSSNAVVDGIGYVDLEAQGQQTLLNYHGDAEIGGTLASVGQRLMEGASRQMLNQSLKALDAMVKERVAGPTATTEVPAASNGSTHGPAQTTDMSIPAPGEPITAAAAVQSLPAQTAQSPLPEPAATFAPERRAVVVPENEQLQPSSVAFGMVNDFMKERPWLPWVVVAFLLGLLLGRSQGGG